MAFEGRCSLSMGRTCRQKLRGVSSEPQKSYSGLDARWPSAVGGRESSVFNIRPYLGLPTAVTAVTVGVTVVTVGVTVGGGWVTVGVVIGSIIHMIETRRSLDQGSSLIMG